MMRSIRKARKGAVSPLPIEIETTADRVTLRSTVGYRHIVSDVRPSTARQLARNLAEVAEVAASGGECSLSTLDGIPRILVETSRNGMIAVSTLDARGLPWDHVGSGSPLGAIELAEVLLAAADEAVELAARKETRGRQASAELRRRLAGERDAVRSGAARILRTL